MDNLVDFLRQGSSFLVEDAQKYLQHHYKLILVGGLVFWRR